MNTDDYIAYLAKRFDKKAMIKRQKLRLEGRLNRTLQRKRKTKI